MRTLNYKIIIATMATMLSLGKASAQCSEGCTQSVTTGTSAANYTVSSGNKLCIPAGVTYTGTVEILAGGTVENCGTIQGSVLLQGGSVINNGVLSPLLLTQAGGELINNNIFNYDKNLSTLTGRIVNNGQINMSGADLEMTSGRLILNGDATLRNLTIGLASKMSMANGADLNAVALNMAGDSIYVDSASKISLNAMTIFNKARVYSKGAITVETSLINDGKLVTAEDLLVKDNFVVGRTGTFIQETGTYAYVGGSFENLDGIFLAYGKMRINERFKNDGYLLLNDHAAILSTDLTNDGILDGCGCACDRGIAVANLSVNTGDVIGDLDFCDSTGGRFDIDFGYIAPSVTFCEATLPVKMLSFTAEEVNKAVLLKWSTASEYNNSHFEVMKSENASEWVVIGRVEGNGTSTTVNKYEFTHLLNTSAPAVYFRLKQIDYDGKFEYSPVVVVKPGMNSKFNTLVLGNPFNDNLSLSVASKVDGRLNLELLDINGQVVLMDNMEVVSGSNTFNLATSHVENGVYFLRLMIDGVHTETIKVIK